MTKNENITPSPKSNSLVTIIQQAFEIKKNPLPWTKAFCAGLCAALPSLIGLILGNFQYGLLAGIGGFTYLYVFNEPYAQRAKKLFSVLLSLTFAVGLGTLVAPYPILSAVMIGGIGAIATFIFGTLKIPGPAAVFLVLGFAMTTGMPVDPTLAPFRAGLIFLGGTLSWLIAMVGWFFNPHGPETIAVKRVYRELASLLDSVGTETFNEAREKTVVAMKEANNTLIAGYIPWQSSDFYKRLYLLNEHASIIYLEVLDRSVEKNKKLPAELGESVRALSGFIEPKKKASPTRILQPDQDDEDVDHLFTSIYDADAIMNEPMSKINREIQITRLSVKTLFLGAFDKNSIVFLRAVKYGIILMIAALIAYAFEFNRSYWVPLSCAAVLLGSTIMSTFLRAIQRSVGTIVGVVIASLILSMQPEGFFISMIILLLTFLTELFIVRNYTLATMFITPNALVMAESTTQMHNMPFFATTRIIDIIIGCLIGLLGVLIIGRTSASGLLPHLLAKTIRSQAQFLLMLFSEQGKDFHFEKSRVHIKMHTNLTNLRMVYTTALGERPSNKKALEFLWPVIFSIDQLGYLLDSSVKDLDRPLLSDEKLAQFLYILETLAQTAEHHRPYKTKDVPDIKGYYKIHKEIISLQKAIKVCDKNQVTS
ncbi:FUSC family protein [Bacillus cihuensis]|uniref:FUSC family protein n=1 Tax=Bacillus cihuensis TaxID=1208599 RepID=UPI00041D1247|nr:FUSC family protein [Bacillus cihuensis]